MPWGLSKVGAQSYWPRRETLDKSVLKDDERKVWDAKTQIVLETIKRALDKK